MGQFILKTDTAKKVINIELEGTFSNEDGLKSIQAYQQTINPISPAEYALDIDCRKLNVTALMSCRCLKTASSCSRLMASRK